MEKEWQRVTLSIGSILENALSGLPIPVPNPGTQVCPLLLCGWQNSNTVSYSLTPPCQSLTGRAVASTHTSPPPKAALATRHTLNPAVSESLSLHLAPFNNKRKRSLSSAEQHTSGAQIPSHLGAPSACRVTRAQA